MAPEESADKIIHSASVFRKSKIVVGPIPGVTPNQAIRQMRRRTSNIRITRDNKQVVTSAEEESISSTSLSNVIIKMEVKGIKDKFKSHIKEDIRAVDVRFLNTERFAKLYSTSNLSQTEEKKIMHLENFKLDDEGNFNFKGIRKNRDYGDHFEKGDVGSVADDEDSVAKDGSPSRRLLDISGDSATSNNDKTSPRKKRIRSKIPQVKLKRFNTGEHSTFNENDTTENKPSSKRIDNARRSYLKKQGSVDNIITKHLSIPSGTHKNKTSAFINKKQKKSDKLKSPRGIKGILNVSEDTEREFLDSVSESSYSNLSPKITDSNKEKLSSRDISPLDPKKSDISSQKHKEEVNKFFQFGVEGIALKESSRKIGELESKDAGFSQKRIINLKTLQAISETHKEKDSDIKDSNKAQSVQKAEHGSQVKFNSSLKLLKFG